MTHEEWILSVVQSFYDKAKGDVLIGYHFRNIHDFDSHIPRIASFWDLQLLGKTTRGTPLSFDVMEAHRTLGIKRGELGRWLLLFRKTLKEMEKNEFRELSQKWEQRLVFFEGVFSRFLGL
jgi:truncated hemoglobin YjbI